MKWSLNKLTAKTYSSFDVVLLIVKLSRNMDKTKYYLTLLSLCQEEKNC